jgi:23S rRNA pseudouridine2605 synthase
MMERLQKVLAQAGFGSRRKCEDLITAGQVEVDGKVVTELGTKVDPDTQKIKCLGRFVRAPRKLYFALNKPAGFISSTSDERGRKTVMEFFGRVRERVYPIGRLDKDSEGLLLFTNDGELTNLLTHPRYQVERMYHVILRGRLEDAVKARIERGVWLAEGKTGPARVRVKKLLTEETVLDITIKEGLNREVRRIFAKFGLKVRRLKRIQIGPLSLGSLPVGAIRPLTPDEVRELRAHALRGVTDAKH